MGSASKNDSAVRANTSRFVFLVEYEESLLKAAVRQFVWRSFFYKRPKPTAIAMGGAILCSAVLFALGEWTSGLVLLICSVCSMFFIYALVWWWQLRSMRAKLNAMSERRATFRLTDIDLLIEADSGSVGIPWAKIVDVWPARGVWLLVLAPNQFVSLPLRGVPVEALDFLKSKIGSTQ